MWEIIPCLKSTGQSSFFEILKLEPSFAIDLATLEKNYFDLQNIYHPDRYSNKTNQEKIVAMEMSMAINAAYKTLKNPMSRAGYLLKLKGINIDDEASLKPDMELLERIMEDREALALLDNQEGLNLLSVTAKAEQKQLLAQYDQFFQQNSLQEAVRTYMKLKYNAKLIEEIGIKMRFS